MARFVPGRAHQGPSVTAPTADDAHAYSLGECPHCGELVPPGSFAVTAGATGLGSPHVADLVEGFEWCGRTRTGSS
jgi:hypothetical protein